MKGVSNMTHLAKLKFSDKQRSQVKMTVEERLRHKLSVQNHAVTPS